MAMSKKEQEYVQSMLDKESNNIPEGLSNTKLSKEEREIVLIFNEGEGVWIAESSVPKYWRRLEKKGWILDSVQYYPDGTVCAKTFHGSKKGVTISDPFSVRKMSDEQREAARNRFLKTKGNSDELEDDIDDESED